MKFAAGGYTDKEIAYRLRVTPATIRSYWRRLQLKTTGVNRVHVVSLVLKDRFDVAEPL